MTPPFVAPVQFSKPRHVREDVEFEGVRLKDAAARKAATPAEEIANSEPFSAATRRCSACGLRARKAICSMPEVFDPVSFSE
jgi:hypothetical protein